MYKFIDLDTGLPAALNKIKTWVLSKLPTQVSDLINDSGFVTANDVAGIVAGTGDIAIVESQDYVDIFIYGASISISPNMLSLYAAQKSATITVSGSHLKSDISISVPTGFTASPSTITQSDGTVPATSVTITYTGADASTASGNITATAGGTTKSIPVAYSQYQGPTIMADSTLTINAAAGSSNTATLAVSGINLEGNITAALSGTDASKFSVSGSPITPSGGSASGTLTITYSPSSGDSSASATLTLSSTNAASVTVALTGAVSAITTSVDTLSLTTDQNTSTTGTFTVSGTNLTEDISVSASGTGFSVSPATIAQSGGSVSSATVTVTYAPTSSGSHSGSISVSSSGITKTVTLSGTATEAVTPDAEGNFTKAGIHYKIIEGTQNVMVWNGESLSAVAATKYTGAINIPSTVVAGGVTYNVTKIGNYAFRDCTGVTSVTLPNGLVEIGYVAFYNCGFTALNIPDTVTTIGNSVANCTKLVDVTLPNNPAFTTIPAYFLSSCTKIRTLIIPASVTTCTDVFFCNLVPLTTLDIRMTGGKIKGGFGSMPAGSSVIIRKSDGVISKSGYPFAASGAGTRLSNSTLYVPSNLVSTYQSAPGWGTADSNGYGMFTGTNQIQAISE